jgi:predicted NAD-dependent protein-ADP-ribosyltransferase YbiA (DUF1768 family)
LIRFVDFTEHGTANTSRGDKTPLERFLAVQGMGAAMLRYCTMKRQTEQTASAMRIVFVGTFLIVNLGCGSAESPKPAPSLQGAYPAHWWAPISKDGAPGWEILPQEAGPGEVILSKRHELGLLSNFAPTPFTYRGQRYASLEGFWQMMMYPESPEDERAKFPGLKWEYTREQVARLTAFEAKNAGTLAEQNMNTMQIDWVTFEGMKMPYRPAEPGEHYRLIVEATWEKVRQNPEVKRVLLATGDLKLKPDHHQEPNAPAAWRYYDILMDIRAQLRREAGR